MSDDERFAEVDEELDALRSACEQYEDAIGLLAELLTAAVIAIPRESARYENAAARAEHVLEARETPGRKPLGLIPRRLIEQFRDDMKSFAGILGGPPEPSSPKRTRFQVIQAEGSQILHVADIAKKGGMEGQYNTIYALLCLASHCNVRDLDHYLDIGPDDNVRGLRWGPSDQKVEYVLIQSCEFLFIALRCAVDLFKVKVEQDIGALWTRYNDQIEKVPAAGDV